MFGQNLELLHKPDAEIICFIYFFVLVLTSETWQNIEAENIIFNTRFFVQERKVKLLGRLNSSFEKLTFKSTSITKPSSENPKEDFFRELISQISSHTRQGIHRMQGLQSARVKVLYDMLRYALRYHPQDLSTQLKNQNLYEIKVFEEAVGLLGSAAYTLGVRSEEIFQSIKFKKLDSKAEYSLLQKINQTWKDGISNYLKDSNKHRKVSNLDQLNKEGLKLKLEINLNSPSDTEIMVGHIIPYYLVNGSKDLKSATNRMKEQYKVYCNSVKLYNKHTEKRPFFPDSKSFFDGGAWEIAYSEIRELEDPWMEYYTQLQFHLHVTSI
jgi:hypothetical protein